MQSNAPSVLLWLWLTCFCVSINLFFRFGGSDNIRRSRQQASQQHVLPRQEHEHGLGRETQQGRVLSHFCWNDFQPQHHEIALSLHHTIHKEDNLLATKIPNVRVSGHVNCANQFSIDHTTFIRAFFKNN